MATRKSERITRKRKPAAQRTTARPKRTRRAKRRPTAYNPAWSTSDGAAVAHTTGVASGRLDELPRDLLLRAATQKLSWIQRFVREGCPRGKLLVYARMRAEAEGMSIGEVPPYSTLNTWVHRYLADGLAGLVDAPNRHAGTSRSISADIMTHVETAAVLGRGAAGIVSYLAERLPVGETLPTYSSVFRALKRFEQREPHLIAMAREGPTWFREHCEVALSHGIFPGGLRLSIDSTLADAWVCVWVETEWRAFRPVLTVVEDVGSRVFITFNLSLYAIDTGICLGVLGRALDERENYPGLPSVPVPHEISLDKGAEHQGAFREALSILGVNVVPRRANDPRGGAHIESLIGTITREIFSNLLVGYSKTDRVFDPYAPADTDVKRSVVALKYAPYKTEVPVDALPTLADLEARILAWATVYNERPHPALGVNDPRMQAVLSGVQRAAARPHPFASATESAA